MAFAFSNAVAATFLKVVAKDAHIGPNLQLSEDATGIDVPVVEALPNSQTSTDVDGTGASVDDPSAGRLEWSKSKCLMRKIPRLDLAGVQADTEAVNQDQTVEDAYRLPDMLPALLSPTKSKAPRGTMISQALHMGVTASGVFNTLSHAGSLRRGLRRSILQQAPETRTETDLSVLDELLYSCPACTLLTRSARLHLARAASLQMFADGDNICLPGQPMDAVYLILGGEVLVDDPATGSETMLKEGDSLGELYDPPSWNPATPRTRQVLPRALPPRELRWPFTAVALGPVECAAVSQEAWKDIMREEPHWDARQVRQFFEDLPIFGLLSSSELMQLARLVRTMHHAAGQVIYRQGEEGDDLLLIRNGYVRMLRKLCLDDTKREHINRITHNIELLHNKLDQLVTPRRPLLKLRLQLMEQIGADLGETHPSGAMTHRPCLESRGSSSSNANMEGGHGGGGGAWHLPHIQTAGGAAALQSPSSRHQPLQHSPSMAPPPLQSHLSSGAQTPSLSASRTHHQHQTSLHHAPPPHIPPLTSDEDASPAQLMWRQQTGRRGGVHSPSGSAMQGPGTPFGGGGGLHDMHGAGEHGGNSPGGHSLNSKPSIDTSIQVEERLSPAAKHPFMYQLPRNLGVGQQMFAELGLLGSGKVFGESTQDPGRIRRVCSAVADTRVELFQMARQEIQAKMGHVLDFLWKPEPVAGQPLVTDEAIMAKLEKSMKWEIYKKRLMEDIFAKKCAR